MAAASFLWNLRVAADGSENGSPLSHQRRQISAWEGDIDSLRAEVLQGVTQFVALYDHEYDPIRLIRQLQRTSPVAIYRSGQAMTGPNYQKYMLQILKAYNGSSRTKSLPIKQ